MSMIDPHAPVRMTDGLQTRPYEEWRHRNVDD